MSKRKSNTYCSVYGCKTFYSNEGNVSFHTFPKENQSKVKWLNKSGIEEMIDRRKAWVMRLRMDTTNMAKTQLKVCSKLFSKDNFILPDYKLKNASLKKTAVPSQNLPTTSIKLQSPKKRKSPKKRERPLVLTSNNISDNIVTQKTDSTISHSCEHWSNEMLDIDNLDTDNNTMQTEETRHTSSDSGVLTMTIPMVDAGVQVTTGDIFIPFISLVTTPQKLNTMTGIPFFEILDKIVELFIKYYPNTKCYRLSVKEQILLVFIKFKQDLSLIVLSILFKSVTAETCRALYNSTIPLLAHIFKALIYWPSKQEILANMPLCFNNFLDTTVVLDCTEISVQVPKCLACRIRLYSNYKSTFTLKFMIGITPGGLISFVSEPYGGRSSDNAIFE
ncbi:PREDICTED: uncharacterized protein LOC107169384 [Diuraphis noxia]|uniref:uncharacterized protein LOC107169384 n=1 Tax=Diuraphis noxia TaxID=143948 RepID=UPI0007639FD3|nr:PREDICTED: uncharacterized protein LOC107169384 [Diuraphis noxia]